MTTWEIAEAKGLSARVPIAKDVATVDIAPIVSTLINAGRAAVVTRMDMTPEAKRARWSEAFYDVTRNGSKRRRFKRPKIEVEWEAWAKAERKRKRDEKKDRQTLVIECKECGDRYSTLAEAHGLVHRCGQGLVKEGTVTCLSCKSS